MPDDLTAFRAHMDRCSAAVIAPMSRPDIRVTIIVRAPEALPSEAMISTNDSLAVVAEAITHFRGDPDPWQPLSVQCQAINNDLGNPIHTLTQALRAAGATRLVAQMRPAYDRVIVEWAMRTFGGGCG